MAKKQNNDIDLDLDFGLDSDFDDNFENQFDAGSKKSSKRAAVADVFKGTIGGAKSKFTDPKFLGESVRKSLPKSYDTFTSEIDGVADNISKTYKLAVDELKPQVAGIASNVNKIVPESLGAVKKLTNKIDKYFNDQDEYNKQQDNRAAAENMAVTGMLGEVFGQQNEVAKKERAEDKAEARVRDIVDDKRFKSQAAILGRIADSAGRMVSIKEGVELNYQKKSLEFQLRTLFTLQNLTDSTLKYQEVATRQHESIVKNTAMPEFVKMKESERFKEVARNKFYAAAQQKMMEMTGLSKVAGRIADDAKSYIGGIKMGLMGGKDMVEMVREQLETMNDVGGDLGISKAEMSGQMLGAMGANKLRDFFTDNIKETLEEYDGVRRAGSRASTMAMNAGAYGKRLRKSDKVQDMMYADGITGKLGQALSYILSKTGDAGPDMRLKESTKLSDLKEPGVITNKFIRSVEEVIPSWLASIYRELAFTRTGKDPGTSTFDFRKGAIVDKASAKKDALQRISDASSNSVSNSRMDDVLKEYTGGEKLDPAQEKALKSFLFRLSNEKDIVYDDTGIKGSKAYKGLDKGTRAIVDRFNNRYGENDISAEKAEREFNLTSSMSLAKGSRVDMRELIEELISNNGLDTLLEDGIVFYTKDGALDINFDRYMEYAEQGYLATSDRNKKKNIKPLSKMNRRIKRFIKSDVNTKNVGGKVNTNNALNKVRGLGIDSWEYKDGEGSPGTKIGPMAQDVKEKMGDGVAPNGTKIDLVSLNGINMAAIQELADRVDNMMGGDGRGGSLQTIADNTGKIVSILDSRLGTLTPEGIASALGGAGGSIKRGIGKAFGIAGAGAKNSYGMAKGIAGGLIGGAKGIAGYGKDVLIDPALAYINDPENKKALTAGIGSAIQNTLKFGGAVLGQMNKTVFDRIPKALGYAKDKMKSFLNKLYDGIIGPVDLWVKGRAEPAIRAVRMQAGEYKDSVTGKVLKTLKDIESSKGDIIDSTGKIVLTTGEITQGLFDRFGKTVKSKAVNALQVGVHVAGKLAGGAINVARKAGRKLGQLIGLGDGRFSDLADSVSASLKETFGDMSFGVSSEANTAILDIRDMMYRLHPKEAEDIEKDKKSKKKDPAKRDAGIMQSLRKFLKGGKDKAKDAVESIQGSLAAAGIPAAVADKISSVAGISSDTIGKAGGFFSKLAGKFKGGPKTDENGQEIAGPQQPKESNWKRAKDKLGESRLGGYLGKRKEKLAGSKLGGMFGRAKNSRLGGKIGGWLTAGKSMMGGIAGKLGGMFGGGDGEGMGPPEQDNNEAQQGAKLSGRTINTASDHTKGPSYNDKDGDGKREGNALDIQAKMEAEKAERLKVKQLAKSDVKYRGANVVDKLFASAGKIVDGIQDLAGGFLDMLDGPDGKGKGRGKGKIGKGKLGKAGKLGKFAALKQGAKGLFSKLPFFGKGAAAAGTAATAAKGAATAGKAGLLKGLGSKIPGIGTALTLGLGAKEIYDSESSNMSRDEKDKATGAAVGGTGGTLVGMAAGAKLGGAIGTIGGPIGIAAGALIGGGLGALAGSSVGKAAGEYAGKLFSKLRKYAGFKTSSNLDMIRMYQYGLGHTKASENVIPKITRLEMYLTDGRVKYDASGRATFIEKEVIFEDVLDILGIDKGDRTECIVTKEWFNDRFTPVFLHHVTTLYAAAPKFKIDSINSLSKEEKLKYLDGASFEGCPYRLSESPFPGVPALNTDKTFAQNSIQNARIEFTDPKSNALKNPPQVGVTPDATKLAQDTANRIEDDEAKKISNMAAEAVAKRNAALGKMGATTNGSQGPIGEDGPQKDLGKGNDKAADSANDPGVKMPSSIPTAPGGLKDGSNGLQYITFNKKDVSIDSMNPAMKRQLLGMIQEYGELTGKKVILTSGTRTAAQQEALYKANPAKAAKPGRSLHEFGIAVDINTADADALDKMGLMRKYGFTRPVGGETWHVEPAGIQGSISAAKSDPNAAANMVVQGAGLGGSGIGSIKGSKLGSRDPNAGKELLKASSKPIDPVKESGSKSEGGPVKTSALARQGGTNADMLKPTIKTEYKDGNTASPEGGSTVASGTIPKLGDVSEPEAKPSVNGSLKLGGNEGQTPADKVGGPGLKSPSGSNMTSMGGGQGLNPNTPAAGEAGPGNAGQGLDLKGVIAKAAQQAGMDPEMMKAFAAIESSLNPNAAAKTSSAKGLFQFLDSTWQEQVKKHGRKYGLASNVNQFDPYASTVIASEYLKSNLATISSVKKDPNIVDAYLTHFLGAGGARTFLGAPPDRIGAEILPKAARANKGIFFAGNRPLTIGEIYKNLQDKVINKAKSFGINVSAGGMSSTGKSSTQQNVDKVTASTGSLTPTSYTGNGKSEKPVSQSTTSSAPARTSSFGSGAVSTSTDTTSSKPKASGFDRFDPSADVSRSDKSVDPVRAAIDSESHLRTLVDIGNSHLAATRELVAFLKQELPDMLGAKVGDNGKVQGPDASSSEKSKSTDGQVKGPAPKPKAPPRPELNVGRRPLEV